MMKLRSKVLVVNVLVLSTLAIAPNQGAFATTPAATKAALATCSAVDKAVAFADAFSNRKKSTNAAAEKAKMAAAMTTLKAQFGAVASSYSAALKLDPSFKSWQAEISTVLSFNGSNGDAVGAAVSAINGYCAKLKK